MAVLSTLQCRALWSGAECRHTGGVNREFTLVGKIQGRAFMPGKSHLFEKSRAIPSFLL